MQGACQWKELCTAQFWRHWHKQSVPQTCLLWVNSCARGFMLHIAALQQRGCPFRLYFATDGLAVLQSRLLAQARNTFRAGGAHDVKYNAQSSVPETSSPGLSTAQFSMSAALWVQNGSTFADLGTELWGSKPHISAARPEQCKT